MAEISNIVGQIVKFYLSKTATEAVALASSEPNSIFFTELGLIINGTLYAEPNPNITIGNANGTISVGGTDVSVKGLGSAAYQNTSAFATAAQGTLATNAVRSVAQGSANGTISVITGTGEATDISVKGLGSNAFTSTEFLEASKFVAAEIVKALGNTAVNRATADASGNNIASTYATKSEISGLAGAMHLIGVTTTGDTSLTDGATTKPIKLGGQNVTQNSGDVVIHGGFEFVWTGSKWAKLGDDSSYALKATTLSGYGITNAYTKTEVDNAIAAAFTNLAGLDSSNTAGKTIKSIKQVNGVVTVEYQDIQISASQVTGIEASLTGKQNTITASGILKGNGSGSVSAAVAGTDYLAPSALQWN